MAILTVPSDADLDALLGAYDLGEKRSAAGIEAGTVNTSYALEMGKGRFFLRIYEEQAQAGAEAEARLLLHLAASGVPTPAPVQARDGSMVHLLVGKPAALFPWVAGDMLCLEAVTPAAAHAVGGALARMHLAGPAEPVATSLSGGRFGADDLVARCDRVAKSTDQVARVLAEPLRDAVIRLDRKRRADLPRGLVHGDLFRDNVLWHDGKIAALLDFESAHKGPFAYDVAVTILSWSFRDAFDFDVARAIVAGYREVRELEESEREALYVESVFAALRFTITRITDEAIRVGKKWQRFVARREAIEQLGPAGLREALAL
ncbi:MAG: Homoserine kinase [Myxococcaceae bacterium]|nr:Homoserine kinase [Myxococcaceae bacterium]